MRPRPARFRTKINQLIANRNWNAREVEHQEHVIRETRQLKGKIHPDFYQGRMKRARAERKHAINRYLSLRQQIMLESMKRAFGWRGLLRWILTPTPIKARWARAKRKSPIGNLEPVSTSKKK